jgi:hypothetical protein
MLVDSVGGSGAQDHRRFQPLRVERGITPEELVDPGITLATASA